MIKTTQPALHGDQHLPNGSDPIIGLGGELEWEDVGDPIEVGIQFDTSPQAGGWLEAATTSVGPSTRGIYLRADVGSVATPGILLSTDGILSFASNHVQIGANVEIDVTPTVTTLGMGNAALYPRRIDMQLANTTATPQGSKVAIYDANGAAILEVRDNGTFHIKTGASWTADL